MVWYTGLDRVARATGCPVKEIDGWETRGHDGFTACKTIVIHHTAGANNGDDYNSHSTVLNGRPGLPGPLAQFGIGRNTGTIYLFAAGVAWHAGAVKKTAYNNWNAIGIEIENNGTGEKYGAKTYHSAVALAGELVMEFHLAVADVLGHKEVCDPPGRKVDPSFDMDEFRRDVQKYIKAKQGAGSKPAPASAKPKPAAPKPKPKPSKGKSIGQMATEVIQGKHGTGHAHRQASLGIDAATYAKVRAEVNRRLS